MLPQLPLRSIRLCALPRQCSPQHRWRRFHKPLTTPEIRAFSSTPQTHLRNVIPEAIERRIHKGIRKTVVRDHAMVQPSPMTKRAEMLRIREDKVVFPEDLGLLEGTIIRLPFNKLPPVWHKTTRGYLLQWLFSKLKSFVSRVAYRRCIQETGWNLLIPIDLWNRKYLRDMAKRYYVKIYQNFTKGNTQALYKICARPIYRKFFNRLQTRGPFKLKWELNKWKSVRIVSDRVSVFGQDYPDSAYRQVIVRLESIQTLHVASKDSANKNDIEWMPRGAKQMLEKSDEAIQVPESETEQTVVEYLVMQQRVMWGKPEKWKVQGFAVESTPQSLEKDETHQRRELERQIKVAEIGRF